MKMYLSQTSYRPKGVGKTVFDNLLGDPKDSKKPGNKLPSNKLPSNKLPRAKKQKPWKDKNKNKNQGEL